MSEPPHSNYLYNLETVISNANNNNNNLKYKKTLKFHQGCINSQGIQRLSVNYKHVNACSEESIVLIRRKKKNQTIQMFLFHGCVMSMQNERVKRSNKSTVAAASAFRLSIST